METSRLPWWKRKRWAAVLFALVLVGYPLSYGPAVWLPWRHRDQPWVGDFVGFLYRPMDVLAYNGPDSVRRLLGWYAALWMPFDVASSAT